MRIAGIVLILLGSSLFLWVMGLDLLIVPVLMIIVGFMFKNGCGHLHCAGMGLCCGKNDKCGNGKKCGIPGCEKCDRHMCGGEGCGECKK